MTDFRYNSPFEANFDAERAQEFIVNKLISAIHTCQLVKVLKVTPTPGKVGFVDVLPLVQDTDTNGVVVEQTPVYNVPYLRYQAGPSAVIMDPAVDDIGLIMCAERDITNVKVTQIAGPAATERQYSSADALYLGGVLNPDPTQYIKFLPEAAGIEIVTPGDLTINATGDIAITAGGTLNVSITGAATLSAASWTINGPTTFNNNVTAPDVILPNAAMNGHIHNDPQGGAVGPPHN